jgi:nucleoside-diphosphate-sugar epimerase
MKSVILTGGLGFIGRHVRSALHAENIHIYLIVRPNTVIPVDAQGDQTTPIEVDLADHARLYQAVRSLQADAILHIGAIRGGRNVPRETYAKVNIGATETLARVALENNAKLIFCSSVGVFGAIPKEIPPQETTERQYDNYYHATKIVAEERLQTLVRQGLAVIILRPSITYGEGDLGFPYALIRLVDQGLFLNCTSPVHITMGDVRILAQAFIQAAQCHVPSGTAYNICDRTPVALPELVDFIAQQLYQKAYPRIKTLPVALFRIGECIAGKIVRNELWKARFQLISQSWWYDPTPAIRDLQIVPQETIPNFSYVIDWYKTVGR